MNIYLISLTVISPSFNTSRCIPFCLGREKFRTAQRPYCIISMNSSFSTSSNGWSHAMIQRVRSSSNLFWSHGSYKYELKYIYIQRKKNTAAASHCQLKAAFIPTNQVFLNTQLELMNQTASSLARKVFCQGVGCTRVTFTILQDKIELI